MNLYSVNLISRPVFFPSVVVLPRSRGIPLTIKTVKTKSKQPAKREKTETRFTPFLPCFLCLFSLYGNGGPRNLRTGGQNKNQKSGEQNKTQKIFRWILKRKWEVSTCGNHIKWKGARRGDKNAASNSEFTSPGHL